MTTAESCCPLVMLTASNVLYCCLKPQFSSVYFSEFSELNVNPNHPSWPDAKGSQTQAASGKCCIVLSQVNMVLSHY